MLRRCPFFDFSRFQRGARTVAFLHSGNVAPPPGTAGGGQGGKQAHVGIKITEEIILHVHLRPLRARRVLISPLSQAQSQLYVTLGRVVSSL